MHTDKVGELLHFDYIYIGKSSDEKEYILILKDYFSRCVFLLSCANADTETNAEVLIEYLLHSCQY